MEQLVLPVRHEWLTRERARGQIAIEPFEPGFAITVGNAYRRVLLSSIPGAAPTWVKIEGVLHEFSHLQGVNEDTLDIIMNLRKLVFVLHVNRPKLLRLRLQGPRTVMARDFDPDADVEILTPDVVLATLDKDGTLEMEVCVERGRGYQPAEKREPEALPIHAMLIDADFSPVERANFHIESLGDTSAPQERLLLEIWGDGSVTPEAAVGEASRILEDQFELFTEFTHAPPPETEPGETRTEPTVRMELNEHLFRSVDELELSVRASNRCSFNSMRTVGSVLVSPGSVSGGGACVNSVNSSNWSSRIREASPTAASGVTLPSPQISRRSRSCGAEVSPRLSMWKFARSTGEKSASISMAWIGSASGSRFSAGWYPRPRSTHTSISRVPSLSSVARTTSGVK